LSALARNKAYVLITLAYTVQLFAYNPIEFWLPTVLQRDKAIPLAQANSAYGAVVIVAGTLGPLIGRLIGGSAGAAFQERLLLDLHRNRSRVGSTNHRVHGAAKRQVAIRGDLC
jgi:hypothetical protein